MEEKKTSHHSVNMYDRKEAKLTGILDVKSFDEQEILLESELGTLLIHGANLHMERLCLEKGEIDISGRVNSFIYSDKKLAGKNGESFWAKLLK